MTITSPAITESSYSISGYTVEQAGETVVVDSITAAPATDNTPGTISLIVKHGSNITISALQRGSYTIAEPGLSGYDMSATVGGYSATITDNSTTFVLNANTTADITNKPSTVPVKIIKVDQSRQPLEGAEFSLSGNGIDLTRLVSTNRTIKVIRDEEEVDVTEALIYENEALQQDIYTD